MPYYAHTKDTDPTTGVPFPTRAEAHAYADAQTPKFSLAYVPTEDERRAWREREQSRFDDGTYSAVPWAHLGYLPEHYAHISLKSAGAIAYTPSEEHGYQDRQVKANVGRYLEEFLVPVLCGTREEYVRQRVADWIATVKAATASYKIAVTADEIEAVYLNGPTSCMSHHPSDYASHCHPVRVYGNSDLVLAYLGDPATRVTARCLIWPEKKIRSRVYGDTTLHALLDGEGFANGYNGDASFKGARIHAIPDGDGYVVPYVDGAEYLSLSRDGKWLIIDGPGGDDEYPADRTEGISELSSECRRCGSSFRGDYDAFVADGGNYCESCLDESHACDHCDERIWNDDANTLADGDAVYCNRCFARHCFTCEGCGEGFHDDDNAGDNYCQSCHDDRFTTCDECGCDVRVDDAHEVDGRSYCDDCRPDEDDEDTEDGIPEDPAPSDDDSTVGEYIFVMQCDGTWSEDSYQVLYRGLGVVRPLVIHTIPDSSGFTVTHVPTGMRVVHVPTFDRAVAEINALALAAPKFPWETVDSCTFATIPDYLVTSAVICAVRDARVSC